MIKQSGGTSAPWRLMQKSERFMQQKLVFDFSDMPQNSVRRQVNTTEQIGILFGLNRRTCRRLGKAVYQILSNYPPETLFENSVLLKESVAGQKLEFRFSTFPQKLSVSQQLTDKKHGSLRRIGEKCADFEINGTPDQGFEIRFAEPLPAGFEGIRAAEIKQLEKVVSGGDWELAFGRLAKIFNRNRTRLNQLRSGVSIREVCFKSGDDEQAEAILSLVASKTDNPVLILDADGNAEWSNEAFFRLTGIEVDQATASKASAILFGDDRQDFGRGAHQFDESLGLGRTFSLEFCWQPEWADAATGIANTPTWIEFQVTPVRDEKDDIIRWIAIGANITQRRQAELAMQAAKEVAESANKAKSDFLAMMSHEIRTPMNAIIGMTELTLGTQLTIDQRECLTTANNSAQALLQILNDILDLSKVEAQRLELEQTDFNIADLTRETLDTLGVLAQRKDLSLRCHFPLDIHQQLVGDSMRLRQILVNLVGNAIKFTSFGQVEVNVELLDETNDAVTLHYEVKDTGVGIPEGKTSRIFEAFFQTDASVTRNFGGTGLGLAITSELVRLMGGRIWVESKLGKGSTFHFVLTFRKSNRTFVSLPADAGRNLAGKRILVFDGNEAHRLVLKRWMDLWGVESQFAPTGREGQKMFAESPGVFDLAIVDVSLPDIDGFEVVEKLSGDASPISTPILMFSSDDRTATIERCRDNGIQSYLIKPVSPKTLYNAIRLALGEGQNGFSEALETAAGAGIEPAGQALDVLIVDDQTSNRKLICEILKRRGHRFREAGDCQTALELIQTNEFDVVLMDVQMPEMDGLEGTAEIRRLDGDKSLLPIIAVTAYVTEEDRQRCLNASMDDYLAKPINITELLEKVERWGHTTRDNVGLAIEAALDDQLLIHDAPDWATQITRTILNSQATATPDRRDNGETESPTLTPSKMETATIEHPFPLALALERFGGDEALLRMQISFFLEESPELIENIQKAIHLSDSKALLHNAHRLKGLVRTYDDAFASELCDKLEDIGQTGATFDAAEASFVLLSERVDELVERLSQY